MLVPRETPLSLIHLRNMVAVTEAGATVLPPVPGFYQRPTSIDDLLKHTTGKVLDQFGIEHELFRRWSEPARGGQVTTTPTVARSQDLHDCLASYRQQHPEDVLVVDERVSADQDVTALVWELAARGRHAGRLVQRRRTVGARRW